MKEPGLGYGVLIVYNTGYWKAFVRSERPPANQSWIRAVSLGSVGRNRWQLMVTDIVTRATAEAHETGDVHRVMVLVPRLV